MPAGNADDLWATAQGHEERLQALERVLRIVRELQTRVGVLEIEVTALKAERNRIKRYN